MKIEQIEEKIRSISEFISEDERNKQIEEIKESCYPAYKDGWMNLFLKSVVAFVVVSVIGYFGGRESTGFLIFSIIAAIIALFLSIIFKLIMSKKEYEKEINKLVIKIKEEDKENQNADAKKEKNSIESNSSTLKDLEAVKENIKKLENVELPAITFKEDIVSLEKQILEKGGDKVLMDFLRVDSFLNTFKKTMLEHRADIIDFLDIDYYKNQLIEDGKRDRKSLEYIREVMNTTITKAYRGTLVEWAVSKVLKIGNNLEASMQREVATLMFYESIAKAMIIFYLNDQKIRYFEIYEAFEKLGVFDSTWQKNVSVKLDSIEQKLDVIGSQLVSLNENFEKLIDNTEQIIKELENTNSNLADIKLLQAITAYQTYKINKNTKPNG